MCFSLSFGRRLLSWFTVCVLLLGVSGCTLAPSQGNAVSTSGPLTPLPTRTPTARPVPRVPYRPFIQMSNLTSPFMSFDFQISNPTAIAKYYNFVWGASIKNVAAFRAGNPNIFLAYYIPFHVDWGTFTDNHKSYLSYWQNVHPDWILYRCDRTTPAYHSGYTPFDFSNPAYIKWLVDTYARPASAAGYDGLAVDNLVLGNRYNACGVYANGKWVQLYSGKFDDPRWRANIISWLEQMQRALHALPHPLALIPNLGFDGFSPTDPQVLGLIDHVDGILDEGGFTSYGKADLTTTDWVRRIQFMTRVQAEQKPYFLVELFPPPVSAADIQWALSSYLMGRGQWGGVMICTQNQYGSDVRYNEYNAPLGDPLGPMYQSQNVYMRNFMHGMSITNPNATTTYMVTLPFGQVYTDIDGNDVGQTIPLSPHDGIVLLRSS